MQIQIHTEPPRQPSICRALCTTQSRVCVSEPTCRSSSSSSCSATHLSISTAASPHTSVQGPGPRLAVGASVAEGARLFTVLRIRKKIPILLWRLRSRLRPLGRRWWPPKKALRVRFSSSWCPAAADRGHRRSTSTLRLRRSSSWCRRLGASAPSCRCAQVHLLMQLDVEKLISMDEKVIQMLAGRSVQLISSSCCSCVLMLQTQLPGC